MPTIKVDDQEYDYDSLSDAAKQNLQRLQFVEGELARLAAQSAALQIARTAYFTALKQALIPAFDPLAGETIKLG